MRNEKSDKQKKNLSKFVSLILRHKPETIGITLDEHGWADVGELIAGINNTPGNEIDMETLEEIVRTDEKQRYSFNDDHTLIRANQGHSIPVDGRKDPAGRIVAWDGREIRTIYRCAGPYSEEPSLHSSLERYRNGKKSRQPAWKTCDLQD